MDFNTQQIQAIEHLAGPCSVIAVPGAGKTAVMTHRIRNLVENGVPPGSILAVTFAKKAAEEMKERLKKLIPVNGLTICTLHALGYRILATEMGNFELIQNSKQLGAVSEAIKRARAADVAPGQVAGHISRWKANLVSPEAAFAQAPDPDTLKIAEVYKAYEYINEANRQVDFDDFLYKTHRLFQDRPATLERYQAKYKHVLVDEFQDCNNGQYKLCQMLAAPENNLWICGDDCQSIYSFQGANIDNILGFRDVYPQAAQIILSDNYRSTNDILSLANNLIRHNANRIDKTLRSSKAGNGEVAFLSATDEDHEAKQVVEEIRQIDCSYADIAILYRTNAQSRPLEDAMVKAGIPYRIYGGQGFYGRKEVKDMLAYLRLINDPLDNETLLEVINVPTRYLGRAFTRELEDYAGKKRLPFVEALKTVPVDKPYQRRGIQSLLEALDYTRSLPSGLTVGEIVYELRGTIDYDNHLVSEEVSSEDNQRIQNVNQLQQVAGQFRSIPDFLSYVEQVSQAEAEDDPRVDKVTMMSLHRSKGLEYPVVFMVGLADALLPHINGNLEEERRLCYVGVTRAKEKLFLSSPESYNSKPVRKSRFIGEMRGDAPCLHS
jgi:DNA helicase-2/ATP-dependent DNA helicase PcrA